MLQQWFEKYCIVGHFNTLFAMKLAKSWLQPPSSMKEQATNLPETLFKSTQRKCLKLETQVFSVFLPFQSDCSLCCTKFSQSCWYLALALLIVIYFCIFSFDYCFIFSVCAWMCISPSVSKSATCISNISNDTKNAVQNWGMHSCIRLRAVKVSLQFIINHGVILKKGNTVRTSGRYLCLGLFCL